MTTTDAVTARPIAHGAGYAGGFHMVSTITRSVAGASIYQRVNGRLAQGSLALLWGLEGHVILSVCVGVCERRRQSARRARTDTETTSASISARSIEAIESSYAAREAAGERKETRTSVVNFPLGPYHPLLSEPYALRLRLHGERIVAASEPVSGYGRRCLLDLITGQPLEDALVVLERVCAHAGQGYRLALSMSVERAARITAPRSAQLMRIFFAELEMTLSALWSLAELARALNLRSLRALGLEQRERIYDAASAATGQRVYWAISRPGGVRGGIQFGEMRELLDWLRDAVEIWRVATAPKGALRAAAERADARQTQAGAAGKSTPSAGQPARDDARRLVPYDGYRAITLDWTPLDDLPDTVEVASCALRLATRLKLSADIMRVCAESLDDAASAQASAPLKAGQGSATIQTAHGPARVDVTLTGEQTIAQARLTTPCAAALEQAPGWLLGHTLADLPATLIGLNLCPSCADL